MPRTPDPTKVVVAADVLVADVFIDGPARIAMDRICSHSWFDLVASDPLLDDARTVLTQLGDETLADDWYTLIEPLCKIVDHPSRDHPALGSAYAAEAGHLLTYDKALTGAQTGIAMRRAMPISIRTPEAFVKTVTMEALYEANVGDRYPGPDQERS